jgi:hypothetical protein
MAERYVIRVTRATPTWCDPRIRWAYQSQTAETASVSRRNRELKEICKRHRLYK